MHLTLMYQQIVISGVQLCGRSSITAVEYNKPCTEYGRYVIFYNERLDKNIYPTGYEVVNVVTELCEVVVKGEDFTFLNVKYISFITMIR